MYHKRLIDAYQNALKRGKAFVTIWDMIQFILSRMNLENQSESAIRNLVGKVSGIVGIFFNLFLFGIKFSIGWIVHSVSIQADGLNNLTDAASNILSILSFHIASKPADQEHPYGHERSEILASFLMALLIAYLGIEMFKESIGNVFHPQAIDFRWLTIGILLISIVVKLYMYFYNDRLSKQYQSTLLHVVAVDAISDVIGTIGVLISTFLSAWIGFNFDGYMGLVLSFVILKNAYTLLKDTSSSLIGRAPDAEMVKRLEAKILTYKGILGVHDMMIHDYGPGRLFASCHAEVDSEDNILEIHDVIDCIEKDMKEKEGIELVVHMDPIQLRDPLTDSLREKLKKAIREIDRNWDFHDFRIVDGPSHTNLVFDLVVPFDESYTLDQMKDAIIAHMDTKRHIYLSITIDHPIV